MLRISTFLAAGVGLALAACSPSQPPAETAATTEVEPVATAIVNTPAAGAIVSNPIVIEGTAPGDWFFEAQFPIKLVGADGTVLAEAPATAQGETVTEASVPYRAEMVFVVAEETQATLVLQEDMPADNTAPREVRLPVVLGRR